MKIADLSDSYALIPGSVVGDARFFPWQPLPPFRALRAYHADMRDKPPRFAKASDLTGVTILTKRNTRYALETKADLPSVENMFHLRKLPSLASRFDPGKTGRLSRGKFQDT